MDNSGDRIAGQSNGTQDLAYLDNLLTILDDPNLPVSSADECPDPTARRALIESLIRGRCANLAARLCGSGGAQTSREHEDFSWNAKLSRADRDLESVRRLIGPDCDDVIARDYRDVKMMEATAILGDINRLIARGVDVQRAVRRYEQRGGGGSDDTFGRRCGYRREGGRPPLSSGDVTRGQRESVRLQVMSAGGNEGAKEAARGDHRDGEGFPACTALGGPARPSTTKRSATFVMSKEERTTLAEEWRRHAIRSETVTGDGEPRPAEERRREPIRSETVTRDGDARPAEETRRDPSRSETLTRDGDARPAEETRREPSRSETTPRDGEAKLAEETRKEPSMIETTPRDGEAKLAEETRKEPSRSETTPRDGEARPAEERRKEPNASRDADDADGGRCTKPVRVDLKDVVKRQYASANQPSNLLRRQTRVIKPVVSKHPELATIVEEREAKAGTTTTTTTTTTTSSFSGVRCSASPRLQRGKFGLRSPDPANQKRASSSSQQGAGEEPAKSPGDDERRATSATLGDARGDVLAAARSDTVGGRSTPAEEEDVARRNVDLPRDGEPNKASPQRDVGTKTGAVGGGFGEKTPTIQEGSERDRETARDEENREKAKLSRSASDVTRLQRSRLTRAHHEGGAMTGGSVPHHSVPAEPDRSCSPLKFLASVENSITYDQELVVLLWMCDLSERLERRSRDATNRMRASVGVANSTLIKLRLLKESLLNAKVVPVHGGSPH